MAEKSQIEWTDSSWNPTTGCTKVSAGCTNCYADVLAKRLQKMHPEGRYRNGFKLTLHENALNLPLKWKKPKKIFVNSMSDLFHKDVPFKFINKVWDVMLSTERHTYQILTKRPERMVKYIESCGNGYYHGMKNTTPKHIWLGTSVENAKVKNRIQIIKDCLAEVQFISFEPLIGDVGKLDLSGIEWVIVGGESGKNHRPIKKEWVLNILKQCREQKVPFFFKQWGGVTSKSGGRLLDGKTYSEFPTLEKPMWEKIRDGEQF